MSQSLDEKVLGDIRAVVRAFEVTPQAFAAGDYWRNHGEKHASLIREFGFANFKRTINFEYGQWGVTSFRDPKIARLVRNLMRADVLPVGGFLASCGDRDQAGIRWPDLIEPEAASVIRDARFGGRLRLRAYAFYCGLLWQYARTQDRLGCLSRVAEPALGNPMPVRNRGRLISQDLALSALVMNRLAGEIPLGKVRRVLEIGAGYGRLAFLFRSLFPDVEYSILDIPPALAISGNYLGLTLGPESVSPLGDNGDWRRKEDRIRFLLPHQIHDVPDGHFDLVINISSFDEMPPPVIADYLNSVDRTGSRWFYLQGWGKSRVPGRRLGLQEFPYGGDWKRIYTGEDPVVPGFIELILEKKSPWPG